MTLASPLRILALAAVLLLGQTVSSSAFCLESPDHPPAWFDRTATQVAQELSWDKSRHVLALYVSYSELPVVHQQDVLSYDPFRLTFPSVSLDPDTHDLYFTDEKGKRAVIGHLSTGFFTTKVMLNPEVEIAVHRNNSVFTAALQSASR